MKIRRYPKDCQKLTQIKVTMKSDDANGTKKLANSRVYDQLCTGTSGYYGGGHKRASSHETYHYAKKQ